MSSRLYVGNLPYHATEDLITQHFAASGEVKAVNLMIDRMSGQSRGFCFVEMASADAAQKAIASPLLETTIEGARGVIFNITGGLDLSMYEVNEAAEMISRAVDSEAQIIFGASIDPNMNGKVRVTVLAAGFGSRPHRPSASTISGTIEFDKVSPVNMDDIEVPAFLRYRS